MKVYIISKDRFSGSFFDNAYEHEPICVVDSEEKARSKISELANEFITDVASEALIGLPSGNYPKITKDVDNCITIAEDGFEDEDCVCFSYESFEVS